MTCGGTTTIDAAGEQRENSGPPPNLAPHCWKPGESGNPSGRPKGTPSLTAALRRRLLAHPEELEQMIDAAVRQAIAGDPKLLQMIWERSDGKVLDRSEQLIRQIAIEFNEARKEGDDVS